MEIIMIKINVNKKKTVEFDVNVKGVQCENLTGRLSLFYEGIIYSFPASIEAGNVIKVVIPPLNEVISNIPDKAQADLKLEVVGNETFMMPWTGSAFLEHPIKVEAIMKSKLLEEEEQPKVDVEDIREKEEEVEEKSKFDYPPEFFKSMKKIHKAEKKQKEKKKKSKIGEALREKKEKDEERREIKSKKLGEELAKTLLGEAKRKMVPIRKGAVLGFYEYGTKEQKPLKNEKGSKVFVVRNQPPDKYEKEIKDIKKKYNVEFVSSKGEKINIPH